MHFPCPLHPNATSSFSPTRKNGQYLVRIPPEIHRNLAILAAESGVSLNRLASPKLNR
ncbi:MAG: toxin-antitoxin system HicB family antitoxin [Deltaproteobacteria bacterium]|nr:toxin-antitoxin system HicB family antitoxin [Deltaproteobacteria bacterium]